MGLNTTETFDRPSEESVRRVREAAANLERIQNRKAVPIMEADQVQVEVIQEPAPEPPISDDALWQKMCDGDEGYLGHPLGRALGLLIARLALSNPNMVVISGKSGEDSSS